MKTTDTPLLERLFEPVARSLNPEAAQSLLNVRADAKARAGVAALAEKCNEGTLSEEERAEYEMCIWAGKLVAPGGHSSFPGEEERPFFLPPNRRLSYENSPHCILDSHELQAADGTKGFQCLILGLKERYDHRHRFRCPRLARLRRSLGAARQASAKPR